MEFSVVWFIVIATVILSYYGFNHLAWRDRWLFVPYEINQGRRFSGIISHVFIHADWTHLLFNMLSLFAMGEFLASEKGIGPGPFLWLYFLGALASTLWPFARHKHQQHYASLGASGAVSAVVFASIMWNPQMQLYLMFIPFPIPAYIFGPLYLALEYYAMRRVSSNIANDSHLSGALFGVLYIVYLDPDKAYEFLSLFQLNP
jgi:membrane associated rhomboid family serine protease